MQNWGAVSEWKMKRYTAEFKEWAMRQMMPPANRAVIEMSGATGVTTVTLHTWRRQARNIRNSGEYMPGNGKTSDQWSSADKFRVVLETALLSETEIAYYGRANGIYPEQIREWRGACEQANVPLVPKLSAAERAQAKLAAKRIRELERQLKRSEAARAEAAALVTMLKKVDAIWAKKEEE
jgi:transposase-like protein